MMYIPNDRVHSKHGLPESVFRPHELYLGKNNTLALHSVFMLVCAYVFRGLVLKDFRYVTYRLRKHCVSSSIRHKICAAEESVSNINKTIIPYTKAIRCSVIEDLFKLSSTDKHVRVFYTVKLKKRQTLTHVFPGDTLRELRQPGIWNISFPCAPTSTSFICWIQKDGYQRTTNSISAFLCKQKILLPSKKQCTKKTNHGKMI